MRGVLALLAVGAAALGTSMSPAAGRHDEPLADIHRDYLEMTRGPRAIRIMGTCPVSRDPDAARRVFDNEPGSAEFAAATRQLYSDAGDCLWRANQLSTSGIVALGGIAERLIDLDRIDRAARPAGVNARSGGGDYRWTLRSLTDEEASSALPLATCLVDRHAGRVSQILGQRASTKPERDIFNAMRPEISGCIPAGQTWLLQPHILRATLAVVYYGSSRRQAAAGATVAQ